MAKITQAELAEMFGKTLPMEVLDFMASDAMQSDDRVAIVREAFKTMGALHRKLSDDTVLVEAVLTKGGCLTSRRRLSVNGFGHEPSTYFLQHTGPAPSQ